MKSQKTLQWGVQRNNERLVVSFIGELTRDTLLPLWKQRASFLSGQENLPLVWDLKGLTHIDSAGFTLLAELLQDYGKQRQSQLINVPKSVITLADLYDLDEWLKPYLSNS